MFIDSHCHIDGPDFDDDRDLVIERAREAGVTAMLNVGTGDPHSNDFERAVAVADAHRNVFASIGVHPHDAKLYDAEAERRLIELARHSGKVVAWGEIGLDFFYDHSPRPKQLEVFERQLAVAADLSLPVIVHSRSADDETLSVIKNACKTLHTRGVMHCFGGSAEMARALLDLGFMISFAGNVTFKNAENLRAAARCVPLDRLLIETDCPFLTPVPLRGRRNEPAFVVHTAAFLADLYGTTIEEIGAATTQNFLDFFDLQPEI